MISPRLATSLLIAMLAVGQAQAQSVGQAEIEGFVQRVRTCWSIPPEAVGTGASVRVRLELARDGTVIEAAIIDADKSERGGLLARSALRALHSCAPYAFSAESYEQWKQIEINLQP